ncbi:uncharacterized protein LOC103927377 [Pyrus x bretschneideri]|uniref:uncharacterized protein LOC103927377 n=1 Tax=Pyrus x bretschneideri TaxID=225117 RepID=UPI002030DDFC|nr:uncharacterized protein LOC103927377 [Pyrus x bretschneideri]
MLYLDQSSTSPSRTEEVDFPHDDALVISAQFAYAIIERIMVDNGSSVNILQLSVIQKMGLERTIKHKVEVLTGFNRLTSTIIGIIMLDVANLPVVSSQTFMIVSDASPYTGILRQPCLVKIGAVTSIEHQKIRFCIPGRVIREIKGNQDMSQRYIVQVLNESKKNSFTRAVAIEVEKNDSTFAKQQSQ